MQLPIFNDSLDFRQKKEFSKIQIQNTKIACEDFTDRSNQPKTQQPTQNTFPLRWWASSDDNMNEDNGADEAAGHPFLLEREFQQLNVAAVRRRQVMRRRCSKVGCTNQARKGGLCMRHGAKYKRCSSDGCTNQAREGGVCIKHGSKLKRCSTDGCTNYAREGGMCIKHGARHRRAHRRNH